MTSPTATDRSLASLRALVHSFFPTLRFFGRYRYAVHAATATTFEGVSVDASVAPRLPTGVPYAQALAGSSCIPTPGTIAHVMFADGDPAQPVCVGFEGGGASTTTVIDATGEVDVGASAGKVNAGRADATVLRDGDTVTISPGNMSGPVTGIVTITLGQGVPVAVSRLKA